LTCDAVPPPVVLRGGVRFATGLGLGMLPRCPGTWASLAPAALAALAFACGAEPWALRAALATVALFFSFATVRWAPAAERLFGTHDPRHVVSDEIAGQSVALLPAVDPLGTLWAFLAFRVFDVLKPWPIRRLEKLPGGVGILADDLAAGAAGAAVVALVRLAAGA
jgi:phosphatidylglycerophosphatase A